MLNAKIINMMNFQINKELASAYLYLDFANYFEEKGLGGFGHWYRVQAQEEIEHAEKFMDYLHGENEAVRLITIDKIDHDCSNDQEVLEYGLKHEMYVTKLINEIYSEAEKLYDYRTLRFLDWFINEQTEEERNANELIDKYELYAIQCGSGLYQLDKELGER